MKKLAIVSLALALGLFVAAYAHADASSISTEADAAVPTDAPADPVAQMTAQLASLKKQEADPSVSSFSKFFIHLKVRELENKLNLKKALN